MKGDSGRSIIGSSVARTQPELGYDYAADARRLLELECRYCNGCAFFAVASTAPLHYRMASLIGKSMYGSETDVTATHHTRRDPGWHRPQSEDALSGKNFLQTLRQLFAWLLDQGIKGRLRRAAATRAAENGATAHELMAIFGWLDFKEAEIYTRAADRKRLAAQAMDKLGTGTSDGLTPQGKIKVS